MGDAAHLWGVLRGGGRGLAAVPLASFCQQGRRPPTPAVQLLSTCPSSVSWGVLGEAEIFLLPVTELEGPLPVPSRPCPVGSLDRTCQHPVEGASFPSPASSVTP